MHTFLQSQAPKIAAQANAIRASMAKALSQDDLDAIERIVAGIDFAGWSVLSDEVEDLLADVVADASIAALAQVGVDTEARAEIMNIVSADALSYAAERAAEMVGMRRDVIGRLVENPYAKWRIDDSTREYIRADVTQAVEDGWSNDKLAEAFRDSYGFSKERATVIARTETNMAANAGALNGYKASGVVDGKQWITAEDDRVSEECMANGEAGPNGDGVLFDLDAMFPSGDSAPPVHPNCRCAVIPYIDIKQPVSGTTEEADA